MAKKKSTKEATGGLKEGDIVKIHLVGRVNSHEGPVFQVTEEEVAREEGMVEEGKHQHFDPKLVIVGRKQVIDGIDEALVGMKVGEEKKVEISADKAYGPVDPKKKRVMAFREYTKKFKKRPRHGDYVEMGQDQGRVVSLNQGKVAIDMNHMLAGRDVYFTIKVIEKMEGEEAKLRALIEQRFPGVPMDDLKINKDGKILELTFPNQALFMQQFGFGLYILTMELQKEFEDIDKIRCVIEFDRPEPLAPEAEDDKEDEPAGDAEPADESAESTDAGTDTKEEESKEDSTENEEKE